MKNNKETTKINEGSAEIAQVPYELLYREGSSQKDRIAIEVMDLLYRNIPVSQNESCPDFQLSDGTNCWIKKFHEPKKDCNGDYTYGFDVKFDDNSALSHIEFSVKCTGWERNLSAPS